MAHRDKEGWDAILLATVWAIWLGKNKMMFQQKERNKGKQKLILSRGCMQSSNKRCMILHQTQNMLAKRGGAEATIPVEIEKKEK